MTPPRGSSRQRVQVRREGSAYVGTTLAELASESAMCLTWRARGANNLVLRGSGARYPPTE